MTREEAIKELEILKENYWDDDGYGHETEQYDDTMLALDMAIEALEQEPPINKPMVEIDLYSAIKQKYIEREVLDEIRAEIEEQVLESLSDGGDDWFTAEKVNECLEIIDKYKAESEGKESEE